jgi:transcription elongation factor GreA
MVVGVPRPDDRWHLVPVYREEQDVNVPLNREEQVLITRKGYNLRCRELERLRSDERRRLSELLRAARNDGDLDNNPTLLELLGEQAQLEERIAKLAAELAGAKVARPPRGGSAGIGSVVRVRDVDTGEAFEYELVGPLEADPANGRVSMAAPIGRALLGQRRGARIDVATPRGAVALEVVAVGGRTPAKKAA